ncbi:MAG: hypothetical protein RQ862_02585 [Candidatus Caldarchaeales archaeon]|nr:hypothetical protein [Candidatus Caldarchaeales archaeon]
MEVFIKPDLGRGVSLDFEVKTTTDIDVDEDILIWEKNRNPK